MELDLIVIHLQEESQLNNSSDKWIKIVENGVDFEIAELFTLSLGHHILKILMESLPCAE